MNSSLNRIKYHEKRLYKNVFPYPHKSVCRSEEMNYEKMSRAMRYHYGSERQGRKGHLAMVKEKRLFYRYYIYQRIPSLNFRLHWDALIKLSRPFQGFTMFLYFPGQFKISRRFPPPRISNCFAPS